MKFREMELSDYDNLILLWRSSSGVKLRGADSFDGIKKYLKRNPGLSFVVEEGDEIIATIMAGHDGKRGYIQHLSVKEDRRKLGLASKLVSNCVSALKKEGILKSHIHILSDNELAKDLLFLFRGYINIPCLVMVIFLSFSSKAASANDEDVYMSLFQYFNYIIPSTNNSCEIKDNSLTVGMYLSGYLEYVNSNPERLSLSFGCLDDSDDINCTLSYGQKAKQFGNEGWNRILRFKYDKKRRSNERR